MRKFKILNFKFQIEMGKNFFALENYGKEQTSQICQKVYQKRKSENSQRSFRFERTRKVDQRTLSEI